MAFGSLLNDDIFISYSRYDGGDYVVRLDNELTKKGYSCFTDNKGTDAGEEPPAELYRRVKASKMLIFLGTPGAVLQPEYVAREIKVFAEANGTLRIVPISFDRGEAEIEKWQGTGWWEMVKGKTRVRENRAALKSGAPSPEVVSRIIEMSDYTKNKDRLRRNIYIALLIFLLLIGGSVVAVGYGVRKAKDAAAQAEKAEQDARDRILTADKKAAQAEADAAQKTKDADEKRQAAETAAGRAQEQTRAAETATQAAEAKRRDAEEKTRAADGLRLEAQAQATKQQGIAASREKAGESAQMRASEWRKYVKQSRPHKNRCR
ncbi:MAG TPA: toll/interleukin-1 receptor domain-containing protein [Pyrinomonadaceae bacterium]|jgi:flagellar biosynthesis GTPase FlhF